LELGEELAEDIPRLPSPPFAEFPTVSALASDESDTPSTPPSWSPTVTLPRAFMARLEQGVWRI
jgi:hypothetical protein